MGWHEIFNEKFMTVEKAAEFIKSGDVVWAGAFSSVAPQLVDAITDRYEELENVLLVGDFSAAPYKLFDDDKYLGHIEYETLFCGPFERAGMKKGNCRFSPVAFGSSLKSIVEAYKCKTVVCEVTEPDDEGYLYFGVSGVAWNGKVAAQADKIIVQINNCQVPTAGWNHRIHVSEVTAICRYDHEIYQYIQPPVTETDQQIASYIIPFIPDGATVQIGIGGVANAVAYGLERKKHLGIQTEMLTESLVHLAQIGAVDHDRVITSFILGTQEVYDYALTGIPKLGPVDEIITVDVAGKLPQFFAINACMMADMTGQVCSESIGHRQFSGTGGQLDCVRSANMSKGGASFLCMNSRHKTKDGDYESNILLNLPAGQIVTVPRTDVMYIVTEQGIAELFGKSVEDRAKAMINIAHPDYRDELTRQAVDAGLIRSY